MTEFRDYRAMPDSELPKLDADHFWDALAEVHSVTDSETYRFGTLAHLANHTCFTSL